MKIILASCSPRRKDLLQLIGLQPEIVIPQIDESRNPDEKVDRFLERIAIAKGIQIYNRNYHDTLIISADTIVLLDDQVIGKPKDRRQAEHMLARLSGRCHEVWTAISLIFQGRTHVEIAKTLVCFKSLESKEIQHYLDHEEFLDKAGAYAIQGRAAVFIERIEGCFFNVMGFPLHLFYQMTQKVGIDIYGTF